MRILIPGFTGLNQRLAPQRLEDTEATAAVNCDFRTGDLRGYLADGAPSPSVPGSAGASAPSTLFKYDDRLLMTPGLFDIVRSPVSYAVNASSRRVFYTQYPGTGDWRPYQMEETAITNGGGLPALPKRLGVPRPAYAPAMPQHAVNEGEISAMMLRTRSKAGDPPSEVIGTAPHRLTDNTKVVLDYPGVDAGPYRITGSGTNNFLLQNTYLKVLNAEVWLWKASGGAEGRVTVKKNAHGLTDGAQVLVYYNYAQSGYVEVISRTQVFRVINAQTNYFQLSVDGVAEFTYPLSQYDPPVGTVSTGGHNITGSPHFAVVSKDGSVYLSLGTPVSYLGQTGHIPQWKVYTWPSEDGTIHGRWARQETVDQVKDRAYLYTYVNIYGDESAPSEATDTFAVVPGATVTFPAGALATLVQADPQFPAPVQWRVYRTDALGTWRFLMDIPYNATTSPETAESVLDTALGETLMTEGWAIPPDQMTGLISAPNGVIVGFLGKTVIPSVPYAPYAFPLSYQQSVDYDIMGLVSTAAGIAVLTKGLPYLLIGTDPASWAMQKLEVPQSCVSHTSIVDMGDFGIYASPDGLVAIEGSTVKVLTQDLLTRAQWQAYRPETIVAAQAEGRYIATWQPAGGVPRQGFIFDPQTGSFTDTSNAAVAFYNDLLTDSLYQWLPDGSVTIWNHGSTYQSYQWRSKLFQAPRPTNFAACQVLIADYAKATTIQIYADGAPLFVNELSVDTPKALTDATPFRLPAGFYAKDYQITLQGTGWVQAVGLANTLNELREAP